MNSTTGPAARPHQEHPFEVEARARGNKVHRMTGSASAAFLAYEHRLAELQRTDV